MRYRTSLLMATLLLGAVPLVAAPKPNIVFILSDDQAWTDYGFMGHAAIETPCLDKLADRSLVFERGLRCRTALSPVPCLDGDRALSLSAWRHWQ